MENTDYKNYQVFISFRGKDERYEFVSLLKHHLKASNVNVFTDEDTPGERFQNLFKHIRESRIVIVLFTKNYAESTWCLDELVEIRNCIETEKLDFAIPIFYKVKPSNVNKQSGKFGKKFRALQNSLLVEDGNNKTRIEIWKKALEVVTGMSGFVYLKKARSSELDFVMNVVETVKTNLAKIDAKEKSKLHILKSTGDLSGPSCHHQEPVLDLRLEKENFEYYEEMFGTRRGYRHVASSRNGDQFYPLPATVEKVWEPKPVVEAPVKSVLDAPIKPVVEAPIKLVVEAPIKPVVEAPMKPVVEAPIKPVVEAPMKPVVEAPMKPVVEASMKPVVEAPMKPVVEASMKPVVDAPIKPVVEAPIKPVVEAPIKPVVEAPIKPVVEAPNPVIEAPKPVIKAPKRVTKQWSTRVVLIRLCVTVLWCFITGAKDYPEGW